MRVLLTGPSGFIGRHVLQRVLSAESDLHSSDLHTVDIKPLPGGVKGVNHHLVDLLDPAQVRTLISEVRPTHLLHLAWYVTPGKYWSSPDNVRWLHASLDLVEAFVTCGGQRSVIAGTCAEYDWTGPEVSENGLLHERDTPIRPSTLYGATKSALQVMQASLASQNGSSCAWGRIFHLYGPFEHPSRLAPSIIRALLAGQTANCTHGRQIRDFMHVEDVARAFVELLYGSTTGAVNIATGEGVAIAEVARRIAAQVGRPDLLRLGALPEPAADPPRLVADAQRLRATGFRPAFSLDAGLRQTIEWWAEGQRSQFSS